MELVNGMPITEYCDKVDLTTRERLKLFVLVCRAVEHAHQKGIIHRDIKPSNVMVTLYDGVPVPKVIAFGVAKSVLGQLTEKTLFTHLGQMLGTPLYMSPEQAETSGRDVDTRSDIYSLGVMLYELLTGGTPFDRERVREVAYDELRRMIREDDPPRPSARISTLGAAATTISGHRKTDPARLSQLLRRDLDWMVMKAIQKDRTQRYQTASDFERDIERYLADEPIEARPPTLADHAVKWARRHRPLVWSAVALLILSTIGSLVSTLLIGRERSHVLQAYKEKGEQLEATTRAEKLATQQERLAKEQEGLAKEQRKLAEAQKEEAVRQREISDGNLYVAHMRLARHDWEQGQISRLHEMLDSHVPPSGRPDLRGWEWYYYLSLCHKDLMTLRGNGYSFSSVAWSPDGNRLASTDNGGTVHIWSPATGQEILKFSAGKDSLLSVAWSPDRKRLATGSNDRTARIWDAATGEGDFRVSRIQRSGSLGRVEPGRSAFGGWRRGRRKGLGRNQGARDHRPQGQGKIPGRLEPGRQTSGHGEGTHDNFAFQILDALTGRELRSFSPPGGADIFSLAWSPDGKRLASGQYINWARVWEADTGRELLKLWHLGSVEQVAWSPDGKRLATASWAQQVTVWDATTGKETLSLRGHRGRVSSVAWSPDGARLASAGRDGTVKIWTTLGKPDALAIDRAGAVAIDRHGAEALAWSPKGNRVASGGGGKVRLWDPRTGEEVWSLEGTAQGLAWSADGKYLAANKQEGVAIVDTETRKTVVTLPTKGRPAVSWSPTAARLAIVKHGPTDDVEVWDIWTRRKVVWHCPSTEGPLLWSPVWSPDGSRVALAELGLVTIWDAATAKRLLVLRGHASKQWVFSVAWNPDGRRLASGSWDETVKVWDTSDGRELLTLVGHTGAVNYVAWTRDGKRLASAGTDGTVKIWDTSTGQELFSLAGSCVAWSPDGERLAVGGDPEGTIRFYDASSGYAFARGPDYPAEVHLAQIATLMLRGRSYHEAGQFDRAIACYDEMIQLDPKNAIAFKKRGSEYSSKGDLDKAIADYREAIRLDPKYVRAYNERAKVYDKKGEHDKAAADLTESVRLDPNMAAVGCNHRAEVYFSKGENDKAIADFTEAIRLNPKMASSYDRRGWVYYEKGEYDKAIANFNMAIQLDPNHAMAHNKLAWLHATCPDAKYRDGKKAIENANKAYQLDGGKWWGCFDTLAAAYAENGDFQKAKELEAKAIELAATDKSATDKEKAAASSCLELYKQGKPYREEPKK